MIALLALAIAEAPAQTSPCVAQTTVRREGMYQPGEPVAPEARLIGFGVEPAGDPTLRAWQDGLLADEVALDAEAIGPLVWGLTPDTPLTPGLVYEGTPMNGELVSVRVEDREAAPPEEAPTILLARNRRADSATCGTQRWTQVILDVDEDVLVELAWADDAPTDDTPRQLSVGSEALIARSRESRMLHARAWSVDGEPGPWSEALKATGCAHTRAPFGVALLLPLVVVRRRGGRPTPRRAT